MTPRWMIKPQGINMAILAKGKGKLRLVANTFAGSDIKLDIRKLKKGARIRW